MTRDQLPVNSSLFSGKRYEMKPYKQLTYEQPCQIEVLKKSGISQQEIAALIVTVYVP
jgi:hypothetical protein